MMLDLERFVSACRAAIAGPSPELAIKEILARAVSSPGDVEAALGTPRQGEVATLYHGRDLTVLNVVWTPGIEVPPHNHRMWALIGLYGGDFFGTPRSEWDPRTHEERPFDIERTRKLFADANTRWLDARTPSAG